MENPLEPSILDLTKKALGLDKDYDVFDPDILMHINSVFSTLNQLGVGPEDGFSIVDDTTAWSEFIGENKKIESVKSYIYAKVRLMFDPPSTSYGIKAFEEYCKEFEWRLNVQAEGEYA